MLTAAVDNVGYPIHPLYPGHPSRYVTHPINHSASLFSAKRVANL